MPLKEEERVTLIDYRIEKAKKAEGDVEFLIRNDKLPLAINRIYYGSFYILTALALAYQFNTAKHKELIGWFNKKFVKGAIIEKKFGQFIHKAYDKRSKGDYADYITFDKDEVLGMLKEMKDFIKRIEKLIRQRITGGDLETFV